MIDRDFDNFVFATGRQPNELEIMLYDAFLPEEIIGRNGVMYNMLKTSNPKVFGVFDSYMKLYKLASSSFSADDFHPYFMHVIKHSYYRPGDEIWTVDSIVAPRVIKKFFNRYSPSLYSVFSRSRSFAIDISLAGGSIEGLASREYFVFPSGSGSVSKLISATRGLRRCGVVTSDDIIRLVSGNEDAAALPVSVIPPLPLPAALEVDDAGDFDAGFITAFSKAIDLATPFEFPFRVDFPGKEYKNHSLYKLGYAGRLSRLYNVIPPEFKGKITNPAGISVWFLPLAADENGISTMVSDRVLYAVSGYKPAFGCVAAKFTEGEITGDMFPGFDISDFHPVENKTGGVIVLSQNMFNAYYVGRLVQVPLMEE